MADRQKPHFSKERWVFYFKGTPRMVEKIDPNDIFLSKFNIA